MEQHTRDITTLGLNDGQSSQGTASVLVVHLGSTLEKSGVEIEDVTRISFTTWRTTEKKRHLTVSNSLLGQIVINNQSMSAVVTEPLADGASSEGSDVLKGSGLRGSSGDNDGVLHGVVLLEGLDELSNSRSLLSDGDVDAVELLCLVGAIVPLLLIQDGVESDGSLTSLTITNDQLTLTTSDRNHGIDSLETSLDGLIDRLSGKNTGSLELSTALLLGLNWALSIDWATESIDDTAKKFWSNWNINLKIFSLVPFLITSKIPVTDAKSRSILQFLQFA
jgi:hypothetical protein